MPAQSIRYLIIPGWQGSPAEHWQSHWQASLPNALRVEQDNWQQPQQATWIATLNSYIEQSPTAVVLIAHSLGCITVANWAAQAQASELAKVSGALLVAPADVERPHCPEALINFAPIASQALPFASLLVGSSNDPASSVARSLTLARLWGSIPVVLPEAGHINVKSGHTQWEQGFAYLYRLQKLIDDAQRRRA